MAWIESHQSVWEHAKTRKAARRLGIPTVQLVGHLQSLWHWAIDHAEDGNLSKYDADDLSIAARWDDDPQTFVDALVECGPGGTAGFLERGGAYGEPDDEVTGDLVIHDWWEYAGKLVARRRRDRARKRAARSDSPPEDVQRTSDGQDVERPADAASRGTNQPTVDQPDQQTNGARKRACRLPDDWRPEQEPELVKAIGGQDTAKREWAKFRDYWQAKSGKDATKLDWQATWRNWLRRTAESMPDAPLVRPAPVEDAEARQAEDEARFRALTGEVKAS